ncbi:MAG: hydrogenase maturation protease [Bacteroidetes bacterium]|nr:hydrogenase maturation protease [Bacteroidota bacterium]
MNIPEKSVPKILILGIGNVLLGDEGVGVHAIKFLESKKIPANVVLLDGGTGGFHLLKFMEEYNPVILIDATLDNEEEGTLRLREPKFASDFPKALSSHDIGLKDLIETASLLGHLPKVYLITVSIKALDDIKLELTEKIKEQMEPIYKMIIDILIQLQVT